MGRREHLLPARRLVPPAFQYGQGARAPLGSALRQPDSSTRFQSLAPENRRRRVSQRRRRRLDDSLRERRPGNLPALPGRAQGERSDFVESVQIVQVVQAVQNVGRIKEHGRPPKRVRLTRLSNVEWKSFLELRILFFLLFFLLKRARTYNRPTVSFRSFFISSPDLLTMRAAELRVS